MNLCGETLIYFKYIVNYFLFIVLQLSMTFWIKYITQNNVIYSCKIWIYIFFMWHRLKNARVFSVTLGHTFCGKMCYNLYVRTTIKLNFRYKFLFLSVMCNGIFNPLTAKLLNLNFHPLEVVSRWRDPQLQVSENYSDLTK